MGDFEDRLIEEAKKARNNAYAPYSNFKVGASLLTKRGRIYSGANVENASYGLTVCAERIAVFKAVTDGERDFIAIAVVADTEDLTPPCGACLQVLLEFSPDMKVILSNLKGDRKTFSLKELIPHPFKFQK